MAVDGDGCAYVAPMIPDGCGAADSALGVCMFAMGCALAAERTAAKPPSFGASGIGACLSMRSSLATGGDSVRLTMTRSIVLAVNGSSTRIGEGIFISIGEGVAFSGMPAAAVLMVPNPRLPVISDLLTLVVDCSAV